MEILFKKIINNPANKKVLDFLGINKSESIRFKKWEDSLSGFDEGGCIFFDKYGADLPKQTKYSFDLHNILVNDATGEIFAFHTGRLSVFLKCDFDKNGLTNNDTYRKGYTLDCISDITVLGDNWCYIDKFIGDEQQQLKHSYELTKKTNR